MHHQVAQAGPANRRPRLIAAILAGACAVVVLSGCASTPPVAGAPSTSPSPAAPLGTPADVAPSTSAPSTSAPPASAPSASERSTAAALRRVKVGGDGTATTHQIAAVQKFADDLADGAIGHLVSSCWTWPASEIRAQFGSLEQRKSALADLARKPDSTERAIMWGTAGNYLAFNWPELDSPYACPVPSGDRLTTAQAALVIERLVDRHQGKPYRSSDTEKNYFLLCNGEVGCSDSRLQEESDVSASQWNALKQLSRASLSVTSQGDDYVVTAADGSTRASATFQILDGGYQIITDITAA